MTAGFLMRQTTDDVNIVDNIIEGLESSQLANLVSEDGGFNIVGMDAQANETRKVINDNVNVQENDINAEDGGEKRDGLEKCWLVVRSLKSGKHESGQRLMTNDVLKLGRVKFKVKEIFVEGLESEVGSKFDQRNEGDDVMDVELTTIVREEGDEHVGDLPCRICLSEYYSDENPLVSLCTCSGTMKFIHLNCIQNWLKARLNVRQSGQSISFYWKNFDCELCKKSQPQAIRYPIQKGAKYSISELIEVPKPTGGSQIVLEALNRERRSSGGVHVISLNAEKNSIKLGRGHDSDVRISDISVSRCHAIIKQKSNGFYVEDNMSKFGTLVWIKNPQPLDSLNAIAVQVGRTVMSFTLKKNYNFMPFCFKGITGYIPPNESEKDPKMNTLTLEGEQKEEIDDGTDKEMETESQNKPKDLANKIYNKVPEQRTTQENILLYQKQKNIENDLEDDDKQFDAISGFQCEKNLTQQMEDLPENKKLSHNQAERLMNIQNQQTMSKQLMNQQDPHNQMMDNEGGNNDDIYLNTFNDNGDNNILNFVEEEDQNNNEMNESDGNDDNDNNDSNLDVLNKDNARNNKTPDPNNRNK